MIDPRMVKRAIKDQRANAPVPDFWATEIFGLIAQAQYNRRAREGARTNRRTK